MSKPFLELEQSLIAAKGLRHIDKGKKAKSYARNALREHEHSQIPNTHVEKSGGKALRKSIRISSQRPIGSRKKTAEESKKEKKTVDQRKDDDNIFKLDDEPQKKSDSREEKHDSRQAIHTKPFSSQAQESYKSKVIERKRVSERDEQIAEDESKKGASTEASKVDAAGSNKRSKEKTKSIKSKIRSKEEAKSSKSKRRIHLKKKKKSEKGGVSETESVKAEKQKSERESVKSLKKKKEQSEKGSAEKPKKAKKQEDVSTSSKTKGKSKIVEVGGTLGRSLSRRKTLSGSRGFSFEEEEIIREDVTQPSISMDGDTPSDKVMSEEVAKSHDSSQSRTERGGKKKWSPVKDQSLIYESGSFKRKTKARRIRKVISLKKSKKRVKRKDREGAKRKAAEQDKMNKEKPASLPRKETPFERLIAQTPDHSLEKVRRDKVQKDDKMMLLMKKLDYDDSSARVEAGNGGSAKKSKKKSKKSKKDSKKVSDLIDEKRQPSAKARSAQLERRVSR
ncbi:hypothetical protein TELCIR_13442 [Teladorsagia circumcincta]|uniref:Uncharacterized protein n=1 Tax=Teladorsagia circumcincta TaxID=45464 RepID=A0A2G9U5V6_TELCI|nr:hypothetical protein TELCIR_13442 [Teladorsagia circumcincta]